MIVKTVMLAAGLALSALAPAAQAQIIGGEVEIDGSRNDVIFIGGEMNVRGDVRGEIFAIAGEVDIDADVSGDISIFAGEVSIRGRIGGEVSVAGGDIEIDADVGDEVNLAGGDLTLRGTILGEANLGGGHVLVDAILRDGLHAGGGQVELTGRSEVHGEAEIAGGSVELAGTLHDDARIRGGEVTLSGIFLGDVDVRAEEVYILDTARIGGRLRVRGPVEPVVAQGAQIGELAYEREAFNFGAKDWDNVDIDFGGPWSAMGAPFKLFGLVMAGSAVLLGLAALLVAPNGVSRVAQTFRRRPMVSAVLGFIAVPMSVIFFFVLTVLLAVVIIGIPLIFLLWPLYPVVMCLGYALGGIAIGDLIFNRNPERTLGLGMRLVSLLVVFGVVYALGIVPVIGFLLSLLIWIVGLGAWLLTAFDRPGPARDTGPMLDRDNAARVG